VTVAETPGAGLPGSDLPARDLAQLRQIAEACDRVVRYTAAGCASLADERTYDAVLRGLTIIGEALGALSDHAYARLASVPPHLPKAQRNLIVHEYWRIDPDVVWATVDRHVPALRGDVMAILGK
jgi:uncharacterized protein with HEPN domain